MKTRIIIKIFLEMKPNMLSSYYNTFSAPNTVQMWISVDFDGNIFDNSTVYNFYRM